MKISMLFGNVGILCFKCRADEFDNKFVNITHSIAIMTIYIENAFFVLDTFNFLQSQNKIKDLDRLLNDKDIDFDFYNALSIEYSEDYIFMKDKDGKRIIGYGNDDIIYRDMDKRIDITDDVKKALLPNKKKRKNK